MTFSNIGTDPIVVKPRTFESERAKIISRGRAKDVRKGAAYKACMPELSLDDVREAEWALAWFMRTIVQQSIRLNWRDISIQVVVAEVGSDSDESASGAADVGNPPEVSE